MENTYTLPSDLSLQLDKLAKKFNSTQNQIIIVSLATYLTYFNIDPDQALEILGYIKTDYDHAIKVLTKMGY